LYKMPPKRGVKRPLVESTANSDALPKAKKQTTLPFLPVGGTARSTRNDAVGAPATATATATAASVDDEVAKSAPAKASKAAAAKPEAAKSTEAATASKPKKPAAAKPAKKGPTPEKLYKDALNSIDKTFNTLLKKYKPNPNLLGDDGIVCARSFAHFQDVIGC
jgi:hypothetical protein